MTREYEWASCGQTVTEAVPRNRGVVTTMVGALGITGLVAMMTVEGGTDTAVFLAFLDHVLVPKLKPGDIVVVDNVGAHQSSLVGQRLEAVGAKLLFLPPYSPDLNPIEECWSKLKGLLKSCAARTKQELDHAIAFCMRRVTPQDARAWLRHAGNSYGAN